MPLLGLVANGKSPAQPETSIVNNLVWRIGATVIINLDHGRTSDNIYSVGSIKSQAIGRFISNMALKPDFDLLSV
jgi:hypothetical protein